MCRQVLAALSKALTCLLGFTDAAGALLNYEAAARVEEFRGRLDEARRLFREGWGAMDKGRGANPNGPRFMREWALFEKRAGDLKVSQCPLVLWTIGATADSISALLCTC